jgi:hypothetical protein
MRSLLVRLVTLGTAVALIAGCDQRSITTAVPGGTGGGTGSGGSGSSGAKPLVSIDTPAAGALVNLGDSILVAVRVRDAAGLQSLTIGGYSFRGDASLGTATVTKRYDALPVPAPGAPAIRTGPIDTLIRRYLKPVAPVDTTQDSVVVLAIATNSAGAVDTARRTLRVVTGPRVRVISPVAGDSVQPGIALALQVQATHTEGVSRMTVRVQGEASWPTKLDTTITQTFNSAKEANLEASVLIPQNAPGRGRITITPTATDVNRIPGSAVPVVVFVRATPAPAPRVTQEVPTRAEIRDTVIITASGDGIAVVGFIVRDSTGGLIRRDSIVYAAPYLSPRRAALSLALSPSEQGRRVTITSFAIDRTGRYGYSVPSGTSTPITVDSLAHRDSLLLVHGLTYKLLRPGIAGDLAVDAARGRVFVSNTNFNLLEVWRRDQTRFTQNGVAVGALPWGLTVSATSGDTLLVANSGGTNISKVSIAGDPDSWVAESGRILTRNSVLFEVTETRDPNTNKVRLVVSPPISYSDRPQYIAQSAGGRIYYSTRPTTAAPAGTLRYLNPAEAYPESRQIWRYGKSVGDASSKFVIFNADFVEVCFRAPADSPESDRIRIYDHASGTKSDTKQPACTESLVADAVGQIYSDVPTSDVEAVQGLDYASLALTDTTFVSESGDRKWIAFGEGKTGARPARAMMVNDTLPAGTSLAVPFFSTSIDVSDIMENAAEPVFGLALDKFGKALAVHGAQSYFAAVENPFHLRLQGKYASFSAGAGIAFHPEADVSPESPDGTASLKNLAFVASANGTIEIVDAFFYKRRGRVNTKTNLYGPIRASGPMPGDPPSVIMKLYGLSKDGLVVIDVTARDFQ